MIDREFLQELEGWRLEGYIPHAEGSKSGVTVANGVDLAHTNPYLLDLPRDLQKRLGKYHGVTGEEALEFLANNPLRLTEQEAIQLDDAVYALHMAYIETAWNSDCAVAWACLGKELRTVVFSVLYQYGNKKRVPKFWDHAVNLRWKDVVKELRDFGDRYPTRRNKEADYLENHICGA